MANIELLTAVLPPEGWYCLVGLKQEGHPKQVFVESLVEAADDVLVPQGDGVERARVNGDYGVGHAGLRRDEVRWEIMPSGSGLPNPAHGHAPHRP